MNAETMSASPGLATLRQQARSWWQARTPRERQAVIVVVLVIGLFVLWSLFVQPALRTAREAPGQLDVLDAQYQQMQRIANEATTLRAWLNEARSGARARPIDAQLQRGPTGYTGSIGLTLGGTS